ncbi:primosomal protein N' [bacterium (Candidatus Blackallbacteria) CG17_big_fil_post_rev_8_21_14_2_50_48_46]|uniref:Replication restart protein PriA n=1 Tax=bacterium (Candidatus Blackallbacteria) CG17_big_fil_post_rev_8_21_14_2_50_48_46 TaxID=2014261 RepID=A0A2M7G0L8_9BACT|nr:MAG: primosomal protein N' [bacterium (Candidatus Blackallbacteria) CG18_big_fil_WC_8_21_14_2_50_49_26]PIW15232.1 MAG: primosomal protein N' [bacterium (Candidatus Blackallbacteria) CG17_big_fil_post_rev_8_21_14_2_50_48_46]PIW44819.1 MAG: primosomal protein N' [bacterium (Candidatus Blackallbacteria) CG13_big_fil_rev_8_21_14_2_50_49_14]
MHASPPVLYADVLIEDLPAHVEREIYTYSVPETLRPEIGLGQQATVPFGSRLRLGYIVRLHQSPPPVKTRPLQTISEQQLLEPAFLKWLHWISAYYLCSLSQVLSTALPRQLTGSVRRLLAPLGSVAEFVAQLERRYLLQPDLVDFGKYLISSAPSWKTWQGCKRKFGGRFQGWVDTLRQEGLIEVFDQIQPKVQPLTRLFVTYLREPTGLTPRQAGVLRTLRQAGGYLSLAELLDQSETNAGLVNKLEEKGAVEISNARMRRVPLASLSSKIQSERPPLTETQEQVLAKLLLLLESPPQPEPLALLHGVTGSGKTEVYMHTMARVVEQGGSCIFLLPEIALTPMMLQRLRGFFGEQVAILHSGLGEGEYLDEWERIRDGDAPIVVGARSAVFAPVQKLRLIVIDEEHESSYKQDNGLRYDARTLAMGRVWLTGGLVLLGSATPRLETWQRAQSGEIPYLEMPQRIHAQPLPPVSVVDMRTVFNGSKASAFSPPLRLAIEAALQRDEQVILLLNRRGYAASVLCRSCGETLHCPLCAVSLTYHRSEERLKCHYCDYHCPMPERCAKCKSVAIHTFGLGTQKLEEMTRKLFPQARTIRMDRDTTANKNAHLELLESFGSGQSNVLIGTQMVAKGLDFPKVTVVGLMVADLALNLPDFRAAERTFQLLTQAAGRGGRGDLPARVFLQTYAPEHMAIRHAIRHDFSAFAQEELSLRKDLLYPPFGSLVRLVFVHPRQEQAQQVAEHFAQALRQENLPDLQILGPTPAPIARIRSLFLVQMMLKIPNLQHVRPALRKLARSHAAEVQRLIVDIDPYTML